MGHGWLYRAVEVVLKAVIGLFAAIGMVIGMVANQGLLSKEHRQEYSNTFLSLHKSDSNVTFERFKENVTKTLDKLKSDDDANDASDSPKPGS